jgi:hypothetical protein
MESNSNICEISIGREKSISIKVINISTYATNFCNDTYWNQETKSL